MIRKYFDRLLNTYNLHNKNRWNNQELTGGKRNANRR